MGDCERGCDGCDFADQVQLCELPAPGDLGTGENLGMGENLGTGEDTATIPVCCLEAALLLAPSQESSGQACGALSSWSLLSCWCSG